MPAHSTTQPFPPALADVTLVPDVEPLLAKQRQRLRRDVGVDAGQDPVGVFEDRDLRSQPAPDAPQFQADVAAADHHEVPGNLRIRQRLRARADAVAVHLHPGQDDAPAADGEHDPRRLEACRRAVGRADLHHVRAGEPPRAPVAGDFVLGEQRIDALGERADDVGLPLHHRRQVEVDRTDTDAVHGQLVPGDLQLVARFQQRLGRDAADPEAGAAELRLALDDGGIQPALGGADRRHVAPRSPADHDQVMVHERTPGMESNMGVAGRDACDGGNSGFPSAAAGQQRPAGPARTTVTPPASAGSDPRSCP
jgi:hypothetical protein